MVSEQIADRGISDSKILQAFLRVERHLFVPESWRQQAYHDSPLPIGQQQTISQPYVIALMLSQLDLKPDHKVLEVGAGSGYVAALLATICKDVFTIEHVPDLADAAARRLSKLGYQQVQVKCGDGCLGWPEEAPFDRIIASAAAKDIPRELIKQLKIGGKLILPFGEAEQKLLLLHKTDTGIKEQDLGKVAFVPLVDNDAG